MSENTKTSWKGPPSSSVAPSLNFMFVPSSRNKYAVAKCCAQLGRVVERLGSGKGGGPCRQCFPFFAAFCDSRKTLEKMAQPSHPCVKPGLHNRQIFFLSFPSSRLGCLALACAPKPVWPPDDTACPLAGVFVINVYVLKVSFAAIFVSWMKVGSVNQFNILFYLLGCLWRAQFIKYFGIFPWGEGGGDIHSNLWWGRPSDFPNPYPIPSVRQM